jgi:hypothetical protein
MAAPPKNAAKKFKPFILFFFSVLHKANKKKWNKFLFWIEFVIFALKMRNEE